MLKVGFPIFFLLLTPKPSPLMWVRFYTSLPPPQNLQSQCYTDSSYVVFMWVIRKIQLLDQKPRLAVLVSSYISSTCYVGICFIDFILETFQQPYIVKALYPAVSAVGQDCYCSPEFSH